MNSIIEIQNISKKFRIHHGLQSYLTVRDRISNAIKKKYYTGDEDFWALNHISFKVEQGDSIGIIGKNGAGKSTLLKILSKITPPTSGKIIARGRIASLLEVGTGFHPELTGRENVFLNGSILGMRKKEVDQKFDAIIEFSGVEKFLDTPLKHYSSGMQLRLAFAVAAFLDPEILVIDEVLAVGDTEFQKKCLTKMSEVTTSGRTVLFVSHNMGAVKSLCNKLVMLEKGELAYQGDVNNGINYYISKNEIQNSDDLEHRTDRAGNGNFMFTAIYFETSAGKRVEEVMSGDQLLIHLKFRLKKQMDLNKLIISVALTDELANPVAAFISDEMGIDFSYLAGKEEIVLHIPRLFLRAARYRIKLFSSFRDTMPGSILDSIESAARLDVLSSDFYQSGRMIREGTYSVFNAQFS